METPARTPAARRTEYLHGLADEAIQAADRQAALLTAQEAEKEALTRKRLKLGTAVVKYRAARLEAVGRCEAGAKVFTDAVADVISLAGQERAAMVELGDAHADLLIEASVVRRLSQYLSHQLRQLTGPTSPRFGGINLCAWFRPSADWVVAETRSCAALPGREGNGADDD